MQVREARWRTSVRAIVFGYHSSNVLDIACSVEIANTVAWQFRGRDEDPAGEELRDTALGGRSTSPAPSRLTGP